MIHRKYLNELAALRSSQSDDEIPNIILYRFAARVACGCRKKQEGATGGATVCRIKGSAKGGR